jgi:SAM-dependent methyltransferase
LSPERWLRDYHRDGAVVDDLEVDARLGLPAGAGAGFDWRAAVRRYGHHRLDKGDIPFALIRELYSRLSEDERSRVLDLGSGFGRIGRYGGVLFGVRYTGIEIVEERVREAARASAALGLDGVSFVAGDALELDWPPATCVCLMNSFLPSLTPRALERLEAFVEPGATVVASVGTAAAALAEADWVEELEPERRTGLPSRSLRLFRVC